MIQRKPASSASPQASAASNVTRLHAPTKLFVLDTNVLMHDPTSLFRFEEHDLRRQLGAVYERYLADTPRFVPRRPVRR